METAPRRKKAWMDVVIEWEDGIDYDADQIRVMALTEPEAVASATKRWRKMFGSSDQRCRIAKAWVLTPERRKAFV